MNHKALGNEQVDSLAKQAADGVDAKYLPQSRYADAVQVHEAMNTWIMDIAHVVSQGWREQPVSPTIYFCRLQWKGVNSCMPRHRHSEMDRVSAHRCSGYKLSVG